MSPSAPETLRAADRSAPTRPVKHSFSIAGHRTSVSLEAAFWDALKAAAASESCTLAALVARIDARRGEAGLSSAIRVWILDHLRGQIDRPHSD